jgi:MYXO-CTERM domain-containing protein
MHRFLFVLATTGILFSAGSALAETRTVGAGKQHATLRAALDVVNAGDVIEVYEDQSFTVAEDGPVITRHGDPNAKITLRGMRNAQGKRPKLSGGNQGVLFFRGNHWVFEGFEVTAGEQTCISVKANDITIRDVVVHDCPRHGILALDDAMGSLTLQYVEVYKCGLEKSGEALKHPIYVSSDANPTTGFPGSVFRMEHCYIHDANNGNNVKSRAERNEIRYNWIEGAGYYELELIGPDLPKADVPRHSEVVGNVFFKTNANSHVVRIGSDGSADSNGRYRFVNNTFILSAVTEGLLRADIGIESLEFSNNVGYRFGRSIKSVFRNSETVWAQGQPRISGANNWLPNGSEDVPKELVGTIFGKDPGFTSTNPLDLRPASNSALVDKGVDTSPPAPNAPFPNPVAIPPEFVPNQRAVPPVGSPIKRPRTGAPDIGAYELGSDAPPGAPGSETKQPPAPEGDGNGGDPNNPNTPGNKRDVNVCGCRVVGSDGGPIVPSLLGVALATLVFAVRRRRS